MNAKRICHLNAECFSNIFFFIIILIFTVITIIFEVVVQKKKNEIALDWVKKMTAEFEELPSNRISLSALGLTETLFDTFFYWILYNSYYAFIRMIEGLIKIINNPINVTENQWLKITNRQRTKQKKEWKR